MFLVQPGPSTWKKKRTWPYFNRELVGLVDDRGNNKRGDWGRNFVSRFPSFFFFFFFFGARELIDASICRSLIIVNEAFNIVFYIFTSYSFVFNSETCSTYSSFMLL